MRVIRGVGIAIGFLILTAWFVIFQSMALKFNWAMRDWLPIQFARALCRLMGVRIETYGRPYKERGVLLAANHTSYFDMPVLAAVIPVSFVAKSEVAKWPFFGPLSKLVRTVFVERDRRSKVGEQRDRIRERLEEGVPTHDLPWFGRRHDSCQAQAGRDWPSGAVVRARVIPVVVPPLRSGMREPPRITRLAGQVPDITRRSQGSLW